MFTRTVVIMPEKGKPSECPSTSKESKACLHRGMLFSYKKPSSTDWHTLQPGWVLKTLDKERRQTHNTITMWLRQCRKSRMDKSHRQTVKHPLSWVRRGLTLTAGTSFLLRAWLEIGNQIMMMAVLNKPHTAKTVELYMEVVTDVTHIQWKGYITQVNEAFIKGLGLNTSR